MKFTNSIYYYKDIDINEDYNPNISIIISARNEEKNIKPTTIILIKIKVDVISMLDFTIFF